MSNNTNGISTEMTSQLGEVARLLTSSADSLLDAACILEDIQHGRDEAYAKLDEHDDSLHEYDDSLLDPEDYLTVLEVAWLAKYYMPRENAESIPVPQLQKLLYNMSVADGCPIMLRDKELAFHRGIAVTCLKKIRAKIDSVEDSYMPSVLEGEGDC